MLVPTVGCPCRPLPQVPADSSEPVSGDTPLLLACRLGQADIVELCLDLGEPARLSH